MKKLLSLLLVGLFTGISFASANDDYTILDTPVATNFVVDGHSVPINLDTTKTSLICVSIPTVDWGSVDTTSRNNCVDTVDGNYVPKSSTILTTNYEEYDGDYYVPFTVSNSVVFKGLKNVSSTVGGNAITCSTSCLLKSGITYYFKLRQKFKYVNMNKPLFGASVLFSSDIENDDTPLLGGVGEDFASGITSGVGSLVSGFSNIIPTILLFGLPLLIITIFWNRIWSYLKHVLVGNKPRGDDIANCNLTLNKFGQFEHHIIGSTDHGDFVEIGGMFVAKRDLPNYVDENLNFDYDKYFKAIDDRAGELAFKDSRWYSASSEERMSIFGEYKMRIFKHGL